MPSSRRKVLAAVLGALAWAGTGTRGWGEVTRAPRKPVDRAPVVSLDPPRHLTVLRYKPRVVLAWTYDGALTTGFEVERALPAAPWRRIGTPGQDARRFRDPTSRAGETYLYRIRAVGLGTVSPYSKEIIVTVNAATR